MSEQQNNAEPVPEEYYNTNVPKELIDSRNQEINDAWSEQMTTVTKFFDGGGSHPK